MIDDDAKIFLNSHLRQETKRLLNQEVVVGPDIMLCENFIESKSSSDAKAFVMIAIIARYLPPSVKAVLIRFWQNAFDSKLGDSTTKNFVEEMKLYMRGLTELKKGVSKEAL